MADLTIGGPLDTGTKERADGTTVIGSSDLTTHGVIVGMTGSGKTGLGVVLIEECLSAGVPTLLIDPKGDLTNLCLTFPLLAPTDFEPWVNESDVTKAGVSAAEYAGQQATTWRDGLAGWGIGPERIAALREKVEFQVYTPGSAAGRQLNLVGSLSAPKDGADPEDTADEIESYVTTLLGMMGIQADPLSSREHVLLSSLIQNSWSQGRDLDLATLLAQVQQPPIRKLGVLELDQFYPAKDREAFAIRMNSLLASPGFATWMAGDPVDIEAMLHTEDGRARCAIVTTSHLSDQQRQSVTALILAKFVTWTRRQSGSSELRALLYMDEVAGYLPPTANPPTKKPIMTLLKQARAFGVGVVLSTQNPVDVDYKALSNAGTWLIGRLQTERDKARLMDGLTSAAGNVDLSALGDTISALGRRQFVLKKAGSDSPALTTTRWAMSYLRGPLMKGEIGKLEEIGLVAPLRTSPTDSAPAQVATPATSPAAEPAATATVAAATAGDTLATPPVSGAPATTPPVAGDDESPVSPMIASGIPVSFLDPAAAWCSQIGAMPGSHVQPAVIARVILRYDDTKAAVMHNEEYEAVLFPITPLPNPDDFIAVDYDDRDLKEEASGPLVYGLVKAELGKKTWWTALQRGLADHLVRTKSVEVLTNPDLKLYSRIGETPEAFAARCTETAGTKADAQIAALQKKYEAKLRTAKSKFETAATASEQQAARHEAEHGTGAQVANMLGGLFSGRRSRASMTSEYKKSASSQARVDAANQKVSAAQQAIAELEAELQTEVAAIDAEWDALAGNLQPMQIPLAKSDVAVTDFRLVWVPVA
jgi:hypothetical protein